MFERQGARLSEVELLVCALLLAIGSISLASRYFDTIGGGAVIVAIAALVLAVLSVFVMDQRRGRFSLLVYTLCFIALLLSGIVVAFAFLIGIATILG